MRPGSISHIAPNLRFWWQPSRIAPANSTGFLGLSSGECSVLLTPESIPLNLVTRSINRLIARRFAFAACCGSWELHDWLIVEQWDNDLVLITRDDVVLATTCPDFLTACEQFLATTELCLASTTPAHVRQCF